MYSVMSDVLTEGESGNFKLKKFEIESGNLGAMFQGIPQGRYIKLVSNGEIVMSDTPMEKRTNRTFIREAFGDVLIGGLGIGLIVMPLLQKSEVSSITIIEKNQDVINLVAHQLPKVEHLTIVQGDVFDYTPDRKFDCLYFDIWNYVNSDVYEEMKNLKRKYRKHRKQKEESLYGFIRCWAEYEAKNNKRLM